MKNRDSEPVVNSAPAHEAVKVHRLNGAILAVASEVTIADGLLSPRGSWALSSKSGVGRQQSM